ncbi:MAG: hypothetical protein HXS48_25650 [Theionarchaea archaeon]|nr:MAG: hypothetical protein AYK19_04310 [Theionarchaea archaeon DG-70-1]MBU7030344.1 hypothetical protein [Theionarchaea archaeon]
MTNTDHSFDHLDITNSVLSLAYNLESYPNHLYKAGYSISRIEPKFNVNGGVNPDILFMSDDRGLFAECKGGEYYTGENLGRYDRIAARHLVEKGIDIPAGSIEIDVGIFGKENLEALKDKLLEEGITYPQVIMNKVIQKKYGNDFKDTALQKLFVEPVQIKGKPLQILRFTENSSLRKIAPYVFQAMAARSASKRVEFTTRELTEELMGEIWDSLDRELQKTLSNKVGLFLRRCKNEYLRPYLGKKENVWRIRVKDHWKSRKKFGEDCKRMVKNLDQTSLYDFVYKQ